MKLRAWLKPIFSLAVMAFLVIRYGVAIPVPDQMFQSIWLFPALMITLFVIPITAGLRWRVFLKAVGIQIPFITILSINFRSIFWGMLLPSSDGFALIRCGLAEKQTRAATGTATASIIAEKVMGMLCIGVVALAGTYFIKQDVLPTGLRVCILVYLAVIVAFITGVKLNIRVLTLPEGKIKRFIAGIKSHLQLSITVPVAVKSIVWVLAVQLMGIVTIACLFRYMGIHLPFSLHLCFIPVIQVISLLPVTYSGFGVREGAFVWLYRSVCPEAGTLVSISLMSFLILTVVPALIGGLLSLSEMEGRNE